MYYFFASILPFAALAQSAHISEFKSCKQYEIPLNVTSLNVKWALPPIKSNEDMADFNTELGRRFGPAVNPITPATDSETAVYTISGTFCQPGKGGNGKTLIATPGGGYDRSYWDPPIQPEKYSFVDYAIERGYSIFFYDRLGMASHRSSILKGLIHEIRAGRLTGSSPSQAILVGHSFGSLVTNAVLRSDPGSVDAAVLTGVAYYGVDGTISTQAKQHRLASTQNPAKWGQLDGAYHVSVDVYSTIELFFKAPFYDRKVAQWAEDNKQPTSLLEDATISITNFTSPVFTGPVMVMSGEYDLLACEGYCPGNIEKGASAVFPASKKLVTYSQPGSGHSINLSLNATGSFEVIMSFLKESGF
ncbi:MAG: hypothetical protein M1820_008952 [Bogoriella megaspora]|nr:MAG: hypothetical protein M1820_008952 [Bogoriella megaspora]